MRYRRPYYNSPFTSEALDILPPWMKMRGDKRSVGWQFFNALMGIEGELIQQEIDESTRSLYLPTADIFQPSTIYKTKHTDTPLGTNILVTGSGSISLTDTDDLYTFFHAPPTRISQGDTLYFDGFEDTIIGFALIVDYDPSGAWLMKDGGNHEAYVLNRDILATDYSDDETEVYDSTRSSVVATYNFARRTQSWETTGTDEIANFSSGSYTMQNTPIASSLKVLDFLNLDSSGNATEVDSSLYTLDGDRLDQVGFSASNPVPSGWKSSYIVEYDYSVASKLGPMTTSRSYWDVCRWNQIPVIAPVINSDEYGVRVPFDFVRTSNDNTIALRVRPEIWRPGATGWVDFTYGDVASGVWADDSVQFMANPGSDPNFVSTNPETSVVVVGEDDIRIPRAQYSVFGSGVNNEYIYINPINSGYVNMDVFVHYKAHQPIEASSIQSVDSNDAANDQYLLDISLRNSTIYPYSVIELNATGTVGSALGIANESQIDLYIYPEYAGVSYNRQTDTAWFVDRNNQQVHIFNTSPLTLKERRNLFREDGDRITVNPSGKATIYPFVNMELDTSRQPGACVIKDDFFYLVDGTGLYVFNIYDEDMHVITSFEVPSGITDLSVDLSGNLLASIGSGVLELTPHFDYFIADNEQGIIYYREAYGYIDVTGVQDA